MAEALTLTLFDDMSEAELCRAIQQDAIPVPHGKGSKAVYSEVLGQPDLDNFCHLQATNSLVALNGRWL